MSLSERSERKMAAITKQIEVKHVVVTVAAIRPSVLCPSELGRSRELPAVRGSTMTAFATDFVKLERKLRKLKHKTTKMKY